MQIVELGDYSMTIMKDSSDPPWISVGNFYRNADKYGHAIIVDKGQITCHYNEASDYIYSAGRLILFFKDKISDKYSLNDKVFVSTICK